VAEKENDRAGARGPDPARRVVLKAFVAVGTAVGCGALAVPAARFVLAPVSGGAGSGRWIRTVRLDSLREGDPTRVELVADHQDAWTLEKQVQLGAAWLVRKGDAVTAWSTTCPHLGCAIDKPASGQGFVCPCHDSQFDAAGNRLTGPSPRGLDTLDTKLSPDGYVMVEFRRFRQGTQDKVAVG
jgi:menaquinol-cytochrome c reductase iron-sulfur subunit